MATSLLLDLEVGRPLNKERDMLRRTVAFIGEEGPPQQESRYPLVLRCAFPNELPSLWGMSNSKDPRSSQKGESYSNNRSFIFRTEGFAHTLHL